MIGVCPNSGKWTMPASEGDTCVYCGAELTMWGWSDFDSTGEGGGE